MFTALFYPQQPCIWPGHVIASIKINHAYELDLWSLCEHVYAWLPGMLDDMYLQVLSFES